ncbi:MAG TPA: carbohydrate ABC transporter permease [Firmicutes bacterium]|nr:carbohydrate ABC transporter permease [Bacillota bacterium]
MQRIRKLAREIEISNIFGDFLTKPVRYILLALCLILIIFPFYWLFSCSIKLKQDFLAFPPVFVPVRITLEHFKAIFENQNIILNFYNSLVIALVTTVISVLVGSMAAYAVCKGELSNRIRNICAFWFLIQKMYPAIATAIPIYLVMRNLHLIDTKTALIIMNTSFNLPLVIWLMIGFFNEVPVSLEESAMLDGCNLWQRFFKLILPITKPGLIAAGILTFVATWNEFLFAVILSVRQAKTLPVVIAGFITDRGLEWGQMAAASAIIIVPVIILVWLAQKDFVNGLMMGAVKE